MRINLRAALAAAVVAGCVAVPAAQAAGPHGPAPRPSVVVAIADSGVNPYHEAFYRPRNTAHPCTWVVGFTDCSIPALPLSVGKHTSFTAAVSADQALWASVRPHQWYWIPKTNIIGAVCDTVVGGGPTAAATPSDVPPACILDEENHGTATASSVLTEEPDALLLIHEGNAGAYDMSTAPVTADVQSHSWGSPGFVVPAPLQAVRPVRADPCPVGEARPQTLVFLAAGNEGPTPTLLDCARARPDIQVIGGGYPGHIQANSWTVYDFASWYCRPAASHTSLTEEVEHCGTSFAAPTAAGAAAAALLTLRSQEGYSGRSTTARVTPSVTRSAFVEALRRAASYTPRAKFPVPCMDPTAACFSAWRVGFTPVPEQAPYLFWGYGWLDSTVSDTVVSCARGRACPAKPAEAVQYNEQRQQARSVTGLYALAPEAGNDAGSGRDAGEDVETAVPVRSRIRYSAEVTGTGYDLGDGYLVSGSAGQRLSISSTASPAPAANAGCWAVYRPDGRRLTTSTSGLSCEPGGPPVSGLRLPDNGTYLAVYRVEVPHDYEFSVTVA